jgi:acetylornithine deacetylase
LSKNQIQLPFDVIAHLVVEEEIGGNGSLYAVRHSEKGQCALMLDGNDGLLMHACRGSVWPRITCTGVSCHPGDRASATFASAYDFLKKAIADVETAHAQYCQWLEENPVKYFEGLIPPLNIGMIHAGNWPSTLPTEAFVQMVVGIFPSHPEANADMRKRIENALAADKDLEGHYTCEFIFDVQSGVTDINDPLVTQFHKALIAAGLPGDICVFNAACDIGFYRNIMGVPAINCGVGAKNAHSIHESIKVSDVLKLSHAIVEFLKTRSET